MRRDLTLARRVLVTLAALAGLFAMHGMADHGVASVAVAVPVPAPLAATGAHHDTPTGEHGGQHGDGHGGGGTSGHGMAELCLALLVLAAAGLAAGLLARGRPLLRLLLRRLPPRGQVVVARAARFRDPPDLLRLSVQRC
ncbi:hypothetical protein GUY44_04270 [Pimelobacter simplex]|uniref:Uncharacterized protein n=1 Tax=Nocardioides simplex TaxID=2045 RepID=A0A0A1DQ32_NOCSI|nr:DUF6153 family protein [Pimelobacter simplex]AIY19491.1 hypothetical protein KR76_26900 [Pimelobacter simplex]MCG8149683.1 hypothetical protein [Pimelobacter simplex]GEB15954.1 hypothetical protein NSI01_42690 [Pimelobacter simplex]SFM82935.1 hypothetical protein SAMN05421671_3561 [Pimelobacter simplex]